MSVLGGLGATIEWAQDPSTLVQIAVGAVLLLLGRRLFWLLVAAVGFFIGFWLAETYLAPDSEMLGWLFGLLAGVLAALAAVFLQRFAVTVGGALIAGYTAYWYLSLTWQPLENVHWLLVVVAAVAGLLVARFVFDFGLIFLSSIAGATLLLENLPAAASTNRWLFLVLVVLGAAVQASSLPGKGKKAD